MESKTLRRAAPKRMGENTEQYLYKCCHHHPMEIVPKNRLQHLTISHLPWFVDLGVGDSEAERLRRDIRVPVKRPLEASEALERQPRIEPPRRGASPMPCSEEARIMAKLAPGRAGAGEAKGLPPR